MVKCKSSFLRWSHPLTLASSNLSSVCLQEISSLHFFHITNWDSILRESYFPLPVGWFSLYEWVLVSLNGLSPDSHYMFRHSQTSSLGTPPRYSLSLSLPRPCFFFYHYLVFCGITGFLGSSSVFCLHPGCLIIGNSYLEATSVLSAC